MSSRESILSAIKAGKPAEVPLQEFSFNNAVENKLGKFVNTLTSIGGECLLTDGSSSINDHINSKKEAGIFIVQTIAEFDHYNAENYKLATAKVLQDVDTVYIKGSLAVAENGSIWVNEKQMVNRMLPFICQHLVLAISQKEIVANMHDAYAQIKIDDDGFGVFIAGPSKTADIEQSLVIGAHGPLSLTVFILP